MDSQEINSGTTAVREAHGFDEAALDAWLRAHVDGYRGPLTLRQFKGSQPDPTYKLSTPMRNYLLRRKPPGPLASGAHAVEREARVLSTLAETGFPVAHVYGLCTDDAMIGTWFYVMEGVDGRNIWDTSFPDVPRVDRPLYFDTMNRTDAQLQGLGPVALGYGDFTRSGNYRARQIARWCRQYAADAEAEREHNLDRLIDWPPANVSSGDETTIVHGGFRCDNVVFHPTEPHLIAVLDWEWSTLGHLLADLCYHLIMYRMSPMVIAGLVGTDSAAKIRSEADYVAAYCTRTGRTWITPHDLNFLIAFNMFRLTVIIHGNKARAIRGKAAFGHAEEMIKSMMRLAGLAWEQVRAAG